MIKDGVSKFPKTINRNKKVPIVQKTDHKLNSPNLGRKFPYRQDKNYTPILKGDRN